MPLRLRLMSLALALAACAAPPRTDLPASERVPDAPPPSLVPTSLFEAPLQQVAGRGPALAAGAEDLAARAAALRARGRALSGGVLDSEARTRLEAARPQ